MYVRKKLPKRHSYKKSVQKMLMKLTVGVDFTNLLQEPFTLKDFKTQKDTDDLTVFLHFRDLRKVQAAHKTLVKSTPER